MNTEPVECIGSEVESRHTARLIVQFAKGDTMDSMRVADLLRALDEFREKLIEHRELWGKSLSQPIPSYPVHNIDELEKQSQWLTRRLGALRPYIERFDREWIMRHPATGAVWDALDVSVGLSAVSQIKGPSLRSATEKLNTIAGRLEALDQDDISCRRTQACR